MIPRSVKFGCLIVLSCGSGEIGNPQTVRSQTSANGSHDSSANGGPNSGDGGLFAEASSPKDGGVTPSGDAGGPSVINVDCPKLTSITADANTVYVRADYTGSESGTKTAPYKTVASAFKNAPDGAKIFIAAGTYGESLDVPNKNLSVYGGFASSFGSRTDACASILESSSTSKAVLTAVYSVKSFSLDGVTVRKGSHGFTVDGDSGVPTKYSFTNSVFTKNGTTSENGGALYLSRVTATVRGNVIKANIAARGAAVAASGDVEVTIDNNLVAENLGYSDHGGGLYLGCRKQTVTHNTIRSNEIGKGISYGGWGGGLLVYGGDGDVSYNVYVDNLAGVGGGLFVDDDGHLVEHHDIFFRNRAYQTSEGETRGNAIYIDGTGGGPSGGSSIDATNLTIVDNVYNENRQVAAKVRGSAFFLERDSKLTLRNSILWNNGDLPFYADTANTIAVSYTLAPSKCSGTGSCTFGAGLFYQDPLFADPAKDDYHLKSKSARWNPATQSWTTDSVTSPALNKGDANGTPVELGAYGGTAEASKP